MKKLNILIIDSDDRASMLGLPYHYRKLGHNVYMTKPNSNGPNWKKIPLWPRLLMKSQTQPTVRNIELHGYKTGSEVVFGEDRMLEQEIHDIRSAGLYENDAACDLIDPDVDKVHIDAFHTTGAANIPAAFEYTRKHAPHAKWISSTITHWDFCPGGVRPKNVTRMVPAIYDKEYSDVNVCDFFRHHTEFDVLAVDRTQRLLGPREGFASFNHNYMIRQPDGYRLFNQMNMLLADKGIQVPNFGGNIPGQGADPMFSGGAGLTGKFETLNPRRSALKNLSVRAVVHFKNTDWAGGVPAYAQFAAAPIVTTQHFIDMSHSHETLINNHNCLIVNTPEEAADAVLRLNSDDMLVERLSCGMDDVYNGLFNADYWSAWERLLENLV
jgi:hypothetical protein